MPGRIHLKAKSKYRNVPVTVDGIKFQSKKEAARYQELRAMEQAGEIKGLRCQVSYPLMVAGHRICKYVCDFAYWDGKQHVCEDVKGVKTPVYRIKAALMLACYGIAIRET